MCLVYYLIYAGIAAPMGEERSPAKVRGDSAYPARYHHPRVLGALHTAAAVLALATGLVVFLRPKGSRAHRVIGYTYVASMATLLVTAFFIYRLFGRFGPFHVAAVISSATVLAGFLPAFRRRPEGRWVESHYHYMSWSYIGLLAAGVAAREVTPHPQHDHCHAQQQREGREAGEQAALHALAPTDAARPAGTASPHSGQRSLLARKSYPQLRQRPFLCRRRRFHSAARPKLRQTGSIAAARVTAQHGSETHHQRAAPEACENQENPPPFHPRRMSEPARRSSRYTRIR